MRPALLAALCLLSACFVPEVDLEGKRCDGDHPCVSGYTCSAARCLRAPGGSGGSTGGGPHCGNGILDGDETDLDCGGSCAPCADCQRCSRSADCALGACAGGYCQQALVLTPLPDGGALGEYRAGPGVLLAHYGAGTRMDGFPLSPAMEATHSGGRVAGPGFSPTLCDHFGQLEWDQLDHGGREVTLECGPDRAHALRFSTRSLPAFASGTYGNYGATGGPGWVSFAAAGSGQGRLATGACGAALAQTAGGIGFCSGAGGVLRDGGADWSDHLASYAEIAGNPDSPFIGCGGEGCSGPGCNLQVWVWLGP